jgi:hypothetical protein
MGKVVGDIRFIAGTILKMILQRRRIYRLGRI